MLPEGVPGGRRRMPGEVSRPIVPQVRPGPGPGPLLGRTGHRGGRPRERGEGQVTGFIRPRPADPRRPVGWDRLWSPASGRGGGPVGVRWCGPGPCAVRRGGTATWGRGRRAVGRPRPRTRPGPTTAGPAGPTGNPVRYHPACLRNCRVPSSSPNRPQSSSRWTRIIEQISPRAGGGGTGWPRKAAARSRKSHGRPRQPRPTTTPSHPVAAIMASASDASHRSPLPSTGMVVTAALSSPMACQSACPSRAARRCGRAG